MRLKEVDGQVSVKQLCEWFGYSTTGYYNSLHLRRRQALNEEIVIDLVAEARRQAGSRLGVRKVYHLIEGDLRQQGIKLGRDGLYAMAHRNNLIIRPKKKRRAITTDSSAWRRQFANLYQDMEAEWPEHVWVSDITYLRTREGFVYLSLITDAFSRRIVGWHVHADLSTAGCLSALDKAIENRQYPHHPLIHHSDRGCQYCSADYVARLRSENMAISMTQTGSPYDNAMAESVNGQLKVEYDLDATFENLLHASRVVDEVIAKYNHYRPHGSIAYQKPAEYHASYLDVSLDVNPEPEGQLPLSTSSRTTYQTVNNKPETVI